MSKSSSIRFSSDRDFYDDSFILNELGEYREQYFQAVSPPIFQTSNFVFKTVESLGKAFEDEYGAHLYSRGLNPTSDILRKKLAALDGAEDCLVFNSGSSAIFASVFGNVESGDHIVSVKYPYTWAQKMFENVLPRFNVTTTYIDGRNFENFENAIRENTRIIYLESPNSWNFAIQDLKAVAKLATEKGIITICDNSYCTPIYQKPIHLGIDMVLQSATKYIGGHSDVVGGVLTGKQAMMKNIFNRELLNMGNGCTPYNAWLLLRGLRTLKVRLAHIAQTTQKVIQYLNGHEKIEKVIFPFDPDFPQYELAKKQMTGACGLFTVVLKARSRQQVVDFCESLQHILMAVSWGGHESLAIPKCASIPSKDFDNNNPEHRMIRFYVGLEDAEYIIKDIEQALDKVKV
ncbi:aminotransferase class I/II-fold pyridoxal phosphate-dependent enzyme [Flavobacteriaceae bacterium F89]|uniref:Aminotransferase class I/II-fold pyridoxal phosphate-dependent enzyme n=1 Tax=Cerina litoralis TaxID=2874477 RepID=A0AAE3EXW7_9FLAO|nr:aminotransferase class I/II-fold pyridoxal phosphate-dependent enzyme [Cerina litoralis]MCG2462379.1 aminotransferase class I/II-fold pyridoxal phosphate-dependent enzyme [Cerina litoralis]